MGARLNKFFHWQPEREVFLEPLHRFARPAVRFDRLQIGIDNKHIDVALSPKVLSSATELVRRMVHEDLAANGWGELGLEPTAKDFDAFREIYSGLMEVAVERVHDRVSAPEVIQLLHLILLKMLLEMPGRALENFRNQLQLDAEGFATQLSGRNLELHERLVALAKLEPGVRYRTLRRIFKVVQRLESTNLRKLRKSVLGVSWDIPKLVLFNPLLHLSGFSCESQFMNHYPLLCIDEDEENYFALTNRILCELFGDYLPGWAMSVAVPARRPDGNSKLQNGAFNSFLDGQRLLERALQKEEYTGPSVSWLDAPDNITMLIHPVRSGWFLSDKPSDEETIVPWLDPHWPEFQQRIGTELFQRFMKAGITRRAIAGYRTPRVYHQLEGRVPVREVYNYLAGTIPRRRLMRRIAATSPNLDAGETIKTLDMVSNHIRRMSTLRQQEYVIRYLRDFLSFRRDLKLAYFANQLMSQIRLLTVPEEIKLSRDNGSLYEFPLRAEVEPEGQKIRSHVILKADVRGSTEITRQLLANRLNPATHFSMNFFGPITKLLGDSGAQKVTVEGDALILTIFDYDGASLQSLAVANACGLARKILSVMDTQNTQNRVHGLPELELGLGMAFSNDAPAYLYDERRQDHDLPRRSIRPTGSPLVLLSLRRSVHWKHPPREPSGCEVLTRSSPEDAKPKLLRYNVNGIELDSPAFLKLKSELALHRVRIRDKAGNPQLLSCGTVSRPARSDALVGGSGRRRSSVWEGDVTGDLDPEGRQFYEVITNPKVIGAGTFQVKHQEPGGEYRHIWANTPFNSPDLRSWPISAGSRSLATAPGYRPGGENRSWCRPSPA